MLTNEDEMAATFSWDDVEPTIGRYELSADWTWEEMHRVMSASWVEIEKQDRIVDSMMISPGRSLPPNAMSHLRTLSQDRPANTGILILVGASSFQRSMLEMIIRLFSSTLRREVPLVFADSVERARQIALQRQAERSKLTG